MVTDVCIALHRLALASQKWLHVHSSRFVALFRILQCSLDQLYSFVPSLTPHVLLAHLPTLLPRPNIDSSQIIKDGNGIIRRLAMLFQRRPPIRKAYPLSRQILLDVGEEIVSVSWEALQIREEEVDQLDELMPCCVRVLGLWERV